MKMARIGVICGLIAVAAGCTEQDRRTLALSAAVQACVVNIEARLQELPVAQGVNTQSLCTCFVDRVAEGRNLTELTDIFTGGGQLPNPQMLTECAMEEGRRSGVLVDK
jgi:hypothetical protein